MANDKENYKKPEMKHARRIWYSIKPTKGTADRDRTSKQRTDLASMNSADWKMNSSPMWEHNMLTHAEQSSEHSPEHKKAIVESEWHIVKLSYVDTFSKVREQSCCKSFFLVEILTGTASKVRFFLAVEKKVDILIRNIGAALNLP